MAIFIEHLFTYLTSIFRIYDIHYYGNPEASGVDRAPKETILKILLIFLDCILIGWIVRWIIS